MWPFKRASKLFSLEIYLRGGAIINLDKVSEYEFRNSGDSIVGVQVTQHPSAKFKLLIKTIALSEIVGVVRVND